jgi:hypothetical protein
VLLVLAITASSALVFTNRVELLKLAVILALWAAVVGAFVSVIYRRQSDTDQAKVRDLKLVYDLQLDREISARREYELTVETHLRRELSSELRAQSADEVAALRAELAALRTNLEILFDADLAHRPAIETDRTYQARPDRVTSSRITAVREEREAPAPRAAESPIIDVPEEPLTPAPPPAEDRYRGSHRRPSEETTWMPPVRPGPPPASPPTQNQPPRSTPAKPPPTQPPPAKQAPSVRRQPPKPPMESGPRPQPQQGPPAAPAQPQPRTAEEQPRGRHSGDAEADVAPENRGRHWVPPQAEQGAPSPAPEPEPPAPTDEAEPAPRHRGTDPEDAGPPTGGQSVAELMARLQAGTTTTGGGRRRRRED